MPHSTTYWLPCRLAEQEFDLLAYALTEVGTEAARLLLVKLIANRQVMGELLAGLQWEPPEPLDLPY